MFYSSAPARVCLYGEHQDYLQLDVIPAAINLRLSIYTELSDTNFIHVFSKDLQQRTTISKSITSLTNNKGNLQTYLEAGILALKKFQPHLIIPSLTISIESQIPIASGLSSSAALLVCWIKNISEILELKLKKEEIAELAYDAEHNILGIPCGRMDQYACSFGEIIRLSCVEPPEVVKLKKPDIELLIVDSQTPKLTSKVHGKMVREIKEKVNHFESLSQHKLFESSLETLIEERNNLSKEEYRILKGVVSIKEYTKQAENELSKSQINFEMLGELLTLQHNELKENIGVSIPILDKIVNESLSLGALGAKLTGAGLGGSVVVMTKDNTKDVAERLRQSLKLPVTVVEIDKGVDFKIS